MQVNILDAKSQLSQLIKAAHAGMDVVIANRGEPVARLVPLGAVVPGRARAQLSTQAAVPPRRRGGIVQWLEANPLPAYLQRSAGAIDADIEAERHAWD